MLRSKSTADPNRNLFLSGLPREDYGRLAPNLRSITLSQGEVIERLGEASRYAYFPTTTVLSLMCRMKNGHSAETSMVGREGTTAMAICFGVATAPSYTQVLVAGEALRIGARAIKLEFDRGGALHDLLLRYVYGLFAQISQSVGCNAHHTLDARLCRWLLIVHDRVASDELLLRHDFLSNLLGTRRSAVTIAAGSLREAGLIRYTRGRIRILDREGLEAAACECYGAVKVAVARSKAP